MFTKATIALSAAIILSIASPLSAATKHHGAHVKRPNTIYGDYNELRAPPTSGAPIRPDCWPGCE